ncbi:DinB family protein [Chryseolinea sp. T2]|uniref:DinB family protein n=1 Tax=Chryseolinea sp. T2 TaxID=3129255 RepID=UPI003077DE38
MPWFERKFAFGFMPAMLPFMIERLEGTIVRLEHKLERVNDAILGYPLDDKWSVKQNIGHLMDVDDISAKRVSEIISGAASLSRADIQTQDDYNGMPMWVILEEFTSKRRSNIRRMRDLSESELRMTSLHPRLQVPMNIVDLAWFDAEHDDHHLVRINEILNTLKKSASRSTVKI